jgi:hypothetical protein
MVDLVPQAIEIRVVGVATRAHEQIARAGVGQHMLSCELAQTPLQFVALHRGESKLRHYDRDARVSERGIKTLDVEEARPDSLTRAEQALDVGGFRYPSSARKPERRFRRRRTYWEAGPSDACGPSSDGGSILRDPTWYPCACGIHVFEYGACCGGGKWAYPCLLQKKRSILRTGSAKDRKRIRHREIDQGERAALRIE